MAWTSSSQSLGENGWNIGDRWQFGFASDAAPRRLLKTGGQHLVGPRLSLAGVGFRHRQNLPRRRADVAATTTGDSNEASDLT